MRPLRTAARPALVTHFLHVWQRLTGKGKMEAFLKLGCLKEGWQGVDEAVKDQPLDRALLIHISSMCNGKGLPEKRKWKLPEAGLLKADGRALMRPSRTSRRPGLVLTFLHV
ncbi:hypothetical protein [Endozoicomonas sp. SCSIO W0465]|uniref:hypothetical protein n=1 Tax=Endozoicomonas sp. SCSIO W0465 TaxID=2918516 RepID=UPI00207624CC|nr:hypothetical protein [Endozoicomonas sp. SCSIO W0465]USE34819.1 hypothetical protein MJO57_22210 [Endozoicomonas sp. SCSIO W0465]